MVKSFGAPPIEGLGTTGGFKIIIEDRGNLGLPQLQNVGNQIVAAGNDTPGLVGLFNSSQAETPWLYLDIDRSKCQALGLTMDQVFNTLEYNFGSYYVNNFNQFGRNWQVNVQDDAGLPRPDPRSAQLQVRNNQNQMVPPGNGVVGARHQRPGTDPALQHVLGGGDYRQRRPRAPAPARPCR